LTRKVVSGILHPYNSDKTNAQKSDISTKIDVSSYRRAHRHASCSAGKICRRLWGRNMQQTAVNLIKTSWAPLNSWNFIQLSQQSFRFILLSCIRRSYHSGFTVLQLCPVIHSSLNKADCCGSGAMAGKEIKLEEDTISKIVVANTDSEFWGGEGGGGEGENKIKTEAAAAGLGKVEAQAVTSGWLTTWGPP